MVAYVEPTVAGMLGDLFEESQKILIVAGAGANVIRPEDRSPVVFHNTLGLWQANWAMGRWAVQNLGHKAFIATSFYESGYSTLNAFRLGVESAGGEVAHTVITHVPPDPGDPAGALDTIRQVGPDFVYAFYSGQPAITFVTRYADSDLAGRIPLAGSAFLVDQDGLDIQGHAAVGIKSAVSWADGLTTTRNKSFRGLFQKRTGRSADTFGVLGYDNRPDDHAGGRSCGW